MVTLGRSKCRTWAMQDRVSIELQPPASLPSRARCPCRILYGSARRLDAAPSTSSAWPTLASSPHQSASLHSTSTPRYPNSVRWDYICCDTGIIQQLNRLVDDVSKLHH